MTAKPAPPSVQHNAAQLRFEVQVDGHLAILSYTRDGTRVCLEHTYVPDELRGRGIAAMLVRFALDEARQQSWKVVPRCTFVSGLIERNPKFADLVDRQE